jgi:hypothetical protein
MKWIWLIVFLAFSFIPSLMARKKNAAASAAYGDDSDSEETEDNFFNFDEVEAEEAAPAPEPYFTYEAPQAEVDHVAPVAATIVEEPATTPAFDLRQAIVFQTILTNKYISLENQ